MANCVSNSSMGSEAVSAIVSQLHACGRRIRPATYNGSSFAQEGVCSVAPLMAAAPSTSYYLKKSSIWLMCSKSAQYCHALFALTTDCNFTRTALFIAAAVGPLSNGESGVENAAANCRSNTAP